MNATRTALAAAAAVAMITATAGVANAAPATVRTAAAPKVTVKTVCRTDGKTRVRVDITTFEKDSLVQYNWKLDGRDGHPADALLEGKYDGRLVAFTVPAKSGAQVTVGSDSSSPSDLYNKSVRALKC